MKAQSLRRARHFAAILLCLIGAPLTAETAAIHLTDGSLIRGEVLSLKDGSYLIETQSAGRLSVPEANIVLVEYASKAGSSTRQISPAGASALQLDGETLSVLQQQLMNDPTIMEALLKLQSDPTIQAIINDPQVQAAIASGNIAELMANARVQQLMSHPQIRQITEQVAR